MDDTTELLQPLASDAITDETQPPMEESTTDTTTTATVTTMNVERNVQEEKELNQICTMAVSNLANYIDKIRTHHGEAKREDVIKAQNYF